MGTILGSLNSRHLDLYPNQPPTFNHADGFSFARKPRVMVAKTEDLVSARIPLKFRDYCAHHLLDYQVCRHKNMPFLLRCQHEKHTYLNCELEDYVIRMKEFERERRLREREIRIKANAAEPPPKCV